MDFTQYGGASKEWLAVQATLPPMPVGLSPAQKRDAYNTAREALAAQQLQKVADQIELIDVTIPARDGFALEGRLYWPRTVPKKTDDGYKPVALYMFLHGGGYLLGSLGTEDGDCAATALETTARARDQGKDDGGIVVLNVNYRHTPDYYYPTAWNDVQDALVWVHEVAVPTYGLDPARIVVGGESAGAHLTASLVLQQNLGRLPKNNLPPIAGQVLMIPALVHTDCYAPQLAKLASPDVSSYVQNKDAALLPTATMQWFMRLLTEHATEGLPLDPRNTKLSPGNATVDEVRGLPPTVFGICGQDSLRDEGLLYAHLLTEAGVPVDAHLFKGVPHGYRRHGDNISLSKDWDDVQQGGILWTLSQPTAAKELNLQVHTEHDA